MDQNHYGSNIIDDSQRGDTSLMRHDLQFLPMRFKRFLPQKLKCMADECIFSLKIRISIPLFVLAMKMLILFRVMSFLPGLVKVKTLLDY